ncbi:MAG TPA: hypothetical protein VFZ26_11570 [Gemmatimonadales bacterium]
MSHASAARPVVGLATCRAVPDLSEDDRLLPPALAVHGLAAEPVVWDDPAAAWDRYAAVVIRSCWDYHLDVDRFDAWTRHLEARGISTWNPPDVLRWNARKTYLRELESAGVPAVPTRYPSGTASQDLDDILEDAGWTEAVVKPVVSASARETWRAGLGRAEDGARFRRLVARIPLMVQPYLPEIEREGEWSFCFFGGAYSHAVLKRPRAGDFRVQADHGGAYHGRAAPPSLVDQAAAALAAARRRTVYARVDGCVVDGVLRLMELELLEPGLFLAMDPAAPDRFARAIAGATASARGQE